MTRICDKCGKETDDYEVVGVKAMGVFPGVGSPAAPRVQAPVCTDCIGDMRETM